MKKTIWTLVLLLSFINHLMAQKIFDVHIHGDKEPSNQLVNLSSNGVYKVAVSTSWNLQQKYKENEKFGILHGLMLPCPEGKVPYSSQNCFDNQSDFPDINWVENLMKENKIQFLGEVLTQYYGISPSDPKMHPYYALAKKYEIPVGIHFGLAGPDHGAPNFKVSLGSPILLEETLQKFPKLKIWIMHAGAPFLDDTIAIMKYYNNVYMDISALNNPYIFSESDFHYIMKRLIDSGFEDRIMFGSDNGPIKPIIDNVNKLTFLNQTQKKKDFLQKCRILL
ncbi:amidohydrolase family protein [Flavobacterium adhaerens]|uniref:amidohydrolase family protein n=1 Tax=Flavobacterium adhaerens TaxID=3149043 RepID=UPI0032B3910F